MANTYRLLDWNPGGAIEGIVFVQQDGGKAFVALRGQLGDSVQASVGA